MPTPPREPLISWEDVVRAFSLALAEADIKLEDTQAWPSLLVQTRISRLEKGTSTSPERQLENVCRWCVRFKFFPVHLAHEEVSGSIYRHQRRIQFERAFEDIENDRIVDLRSGQPIKHIACFLYERFTRDPEEGGDWLRLMRQKGINIYETYYGEDPLPLYRTEHSIREAWNIASKEVERNRERIMDALLRRARRGMPIYGTPYTFGHRRVFDADGHVIGYKAAPEEASIVRAKALGIVSGDSLYSVQCWLNDNGITTSTGRKWTYRQVKRLFTSPRIAGLQRLRVQRDRLHDPSYVGDLFPLELIYEEGETPPPTFDPPIEPLIEYPLWAAVLEAIEGRAKKVGPPARYFASGYLTCATCGAKMIGGKSRRAPVYRCPKGHLQGVSRPNGSAASRKSHDGETHPSIRGVATDLLLEEIMFAAVDARTAEETITAVDVKAETSRLDAALLELDKKQSDLSHMLWHQRVDRSTFDTWSNELDEERSRLIEQRKGLNQVKATLIPEGLTLRDLWPELSFERHRQWLDAVFESITVSPARRTGRIELKDRLIFTFRNGYEPPHAELDALILKIESQAQREVAADRVAEEIEDRIFKMWQQGLSTVQIGAALRAEGVPAPRRGRWGPNSISYLLRRVCAERGVTYTSNYSDPSSVPLEVRELMLELYLQLRSYAAVGRELDRLGLKRPSGGTWDSPSVRHVLRGYATRQGAELPAPIYPSGSPGGPRYLSDSMREKIWRMRKVERKTFGEIADWLQRNEIKTASGRTAWNSSTLWHIVDRVEQSKAELPLAEAA